VSTKPQEIPTGLDHLAMVRRGAMFVANETAEHLDAFKVNNDVIGTALNVIYQAATCHRQCHGGAHVLESLCGRAYNLGCAAYDLTIFGLYDEALNLIRGLGELTNLVMLSAIDPPRIQEWLRANRGERLQKYAPGKVRDMLKAKGIEPCATDKWYREMSESYTHVTPATQPNFHGGVAFVGGKYEPDGVKKCFGALLYVLSMLAMFIAKFFKYEDLFAELSGRLRGVPEDQT
jgi:hypothetical protein